MHNDPKNRKGTVEMKEAAEKAEIVEKKAPVIGVVTDCMRLNIREEPYPNAKTLASLPALTQVELENGGHNESFYKVRTAAGVQGYCLKKFIALRR